MAINLRDYLTFLFNNGKGIRANQIAGEYVKKLANGKIVQQKADNTEEEVDLPSGGGGLSPQQATKLSRYNDNPGLNPVGSLTPISLLGEYTNLVFNQTAFNDGTIADGRFMVSGTLGAGGHGILINPLEGDEAVLDLVSPGIVLAIRNPSDVPVVTGTVAAVTKLANDNYVIRVDPASVGSVVAGVLHTLSISNPLEAFLRALPKFRNDWNSGESYIPGDIVAVNLRYYTAVNPSTNRNPATDTRESVWVPLKSHLTRTIERNGDGSYSPSQTFQTYPNDLFIILDDATQKYEIYYNADSTLTGNFESSQIPHLTIRLDKDIDHENSPGAHQDTPRRVSQLPHDLPVNALRILTQEDRGPAGSHSSVSYTHLTLPTKA